MCTKQGTHLRVRFFKLLNAQERDVDGQGSHDAKKKKKKKIKRSGIELQFHRFGNDVM